MSGVEDARQQLHRTRDRLIGVLSELRGIDCDFVVIARHLEDMERPHGWVDINDDMGEALVRVVDMLTTTRFGLGQLDLD